VAVDEPLPLLQAAKRTAANATEPSVVADRRMDTMDFSFFSMVVFLDRRFPEIIFKTR